MSPCSCPGPGCVVSELNGVDVVIPHPVELRSVNGLFIIHIFLTFKRALFRHAEQDLRVLVLQGLHPSMLTFFAEGLLLQLLEGPELPSLVLFVYS